METATLPSQGPSQTLTCWVPLQLKCHLSRSLHGHRSLNSNARSCPRHSRCTPNPVLSKNDTNHRMSLENLSFNFPHEDHLLLLLKCHTPRATTERFGTFTKCLLQLPGDQGCCLRLTMGHLTCSCLPLPPHVRLRRAAGLSVTSGCGTVPSRAGGQYILLGRGQMLLCPLV